MKILGFKPFREVIDLYRRANIGLVCFLPVPNHIDSMPNKLFEYMAAGLPIVPSNLPLWREFIDGCGLTINPEDPKDIAHSVKRIISDPKALRRMGEEG